MVSASSFIQNTSPPASPLGSNLKEDLFFPSVTECDEDQATNELLMDEDALVQQESSDEEQDNTDIQTHLKAQPKTPSHMDKDSTLYCVPPFPSLYPLWFVLFAVYVFL